MLKLIQASDGQCVHELQRNYPLCASFSGCEDCVSATSCGYDATSGRCLPGGAQGPSCPALGMRWK